MTAEQYKVTFPYGATSTPYSKAHPHKGNDRPTPSGTKILIAGDVIGLTGNSGWSTGAHLHTQAGKDFYAQNPINPTKHEFETGEIVQTGTASQWGNYIIIKNHTGVFVVYAHLSKINKKVGFKVGATLIKKLKAEVAAKNKRGDYYKNKAKTIGKQLSNAEKALAEALKRAESLSARPTKDEVQNLKTELKTVRADLEKAQKQTETAKQTFIEETINKIKELFGWN